MPERRDRMTNLMVDLELGYKVNHNIRHFFRTRFCLKMGMIKLQFPWQMMR